MSQIIDLIAEPTTLTPDPICVWGQSQLPPSPSHWLWGQTHLNLYPMPMVEVTVMRTREAHVFTRETEAQVLNEAFEGLAAIGQDKMSSYTKKQI